MGFLPPFFVMHVQPSSSHLVKSEHLVGKITDDKVERDPDSFTLLIASQISFTLADAQPAFSEPEHRMCLLPPSI